MEGNTFSVGSVLAHDIAHLQQENINIVRTLVDIAINFVASGFGLLL
jgi:hypothetical protein